MNERVRFIAEYLEQEMLFSELCERFEVSRKTGYKWVNRYNAGGAAALTDRSRRPLTNPRAVAPVIIELVVELRRKRPRWGPRKLLAVLAHDYPELDLPVPSTVGQILRDRGMVTKRRRRPPRAVRGEKLGGYDAPNAVWCIDFKGHFPVGLKRCNPFTMSDGYSRFLLRTVALQQTLHRAVRKVMEGAFQEYGLPDAIRSDNGPPFVSVTTGGISRLAVWWILLGIKPQRIWPGRPDQNGRHERMHRTLKAETASPPRHTFAAQQRAFDAFREDYNHHRPHEALGQVPPAAFYMPSRRRYTGKLIEPEYPSHFLVQRAYPNGIITFGQIQWYLSCCLGGQRVGIEPVSDGCWRVHFGPATLGLLDLRGAVKRDSRNFGLLTRLPDDQRRRKPKRKG
jgi:putative transposase